MEILDIVCKPYRDVDVSFSGKDADPNSPFGELITEAFAPDGAAPEGLDLKTDEGYDWWDEHCWLPFRYRHPF